MRAKIMQLHFAMPLLMVFTSATTVDPIAFNSSKEMGSRSTMLLGNVSVSPERDFRFAIYKETASLFTPDDLSRKRKLVTGSNIDKLNGNRIKRSNDNFWIKSEIDGTDDFLKMHAFIVRDEDIPECDTPADKVTKRRYFMCSGVILDGNHVLTSATCVNQAHIHEYHIEADLAVLIGALDVENSYIIKIAHYEIHPRYVPDPNSIHHATNNIALLRLSCSIPRKYVVVPKLPSKRFEDIAHFCCSERCKLSTVIENSKNQHIIRFMKLKHLPSPMHIDNKNLNANGNNKNGIKSNPSRIAKVEQQNRNKEVSLESLGGRSIRQSINNVKTTNSTDSSKRSRSTNSFIPDDDEVIDWNEVKMEIYAAKVSQKNQKLLSDFVQNSMSDVMTKLLDVVTHHIADMNNVFSYFQNILQKDVLRKRKSYQKISDFIGKSVLKFAMEKMSIIANNCIQNCSECVALEKFNVETHVDNKKSESNIAAQDELHTSSTAEAIKANKTGMSKKGENEMKISEIRQESEKSEDLLNEDKNTVLTENIYCPPLGSPVIVNKTLVGLIAYTCNDVQNWVEWKYVNIIHNIPWIRKELKRNLTENLHLSNIKDK